MFGGAGGFSDEVTEEALAEMKVWAFMVKQGLASEFPDYMLTTALACLDVCRFAKHVNPQHLTENKDVLQNLKRIAQKLKLNFPRLVE